MRPDDSVAHNNLGIALFQTGRIQEAVEQFNQALKLKPDYANACYNLAMAYARLQEPAQAMAAAQKALELARSQGQTAMVKTIENWLNAHHREPSK